MLAIFVMHLDIDNYIFQLVITGLAADLNYSYVYLSRKGYIILKCNNLQLRSFKLKTVKIYHSNRPSFMALDSVAAAMSLIAFFLIFELFKNGML